MKKIYQEKVFVFPYDSYRFAGQATDERILYITREHKFFLFIKMFFVLLIAAAIFLATYVFSLAFKNIFAFDYPSFLLPLILILIVALIIIGFWWVYSVWQKSLAILTNQRLTKIIYTTPFNRYNQSLPLEMIVDTSCSNQGFFGGIAHSLLKIDTLTARSSASSSGVATNDVSRVNKKYFYLENIQYCEDLQQYLNKILSMLSHSPERLSSFRPFVPNLKAEARAKFLQENYKVGEEGVEVKKEQNKIEEQAQLSQEEKPIS
ncbi:MAG TPA: hypothetical protein PLQ50_01130 [Candidatus Woesebacteria bacterium]|nr:hypothetical protein [Candidatus Woesebacteria bacterium]